MNWFQVILGKSWPQRIIILGAIGLYIYLGITKPETAKKGVGDSAKTLLSLFPLIFSALLIARAIGMLLPAETVMNWFGEGSGLKGVISGSLLGGMLQGGPYAVYPIIKSLYDKGAHISVVLSMMIGYGAIGIGRVVYGLIFFNPQIVGLRLLFAIPATIIVGIIAYLVL